MRNKNRWTSTQGFTLLEILMVLALLGIVIGVVAPRVQSSFSTGQVRTTKLQIKQLEGIMERYRVDCNQYPTDLKALLPSGDDAACPNKDPSGYFDGKKTLPKDAWGTELQYEAKGQTEYVIRSLGADKAPGGEGNNKDIESGQD